MTAALRATGRFIRRVIEFAIMLCLASFLTLAWTLNLIDLIRWFP